jgi:hypothetical protein
MNGAPIALFPIALYLLEQPSQQLPSKESPDQYVEMLHVSQGIQKICYRKEEAGFILTNSSIGLVENAVKEDILNRRVQPTYLP